MAPKRAAKKAAAPKRAAKKAAVRPPSPRPPAESSDETHSGSRSDESEDEKTIADSPVSASTPALKNTPAPPQKGDDSESSDDDDEEEEPIRAPPRNQPPPPQKKEDSDASGSDEEEEEEDEDDEEEEPARAAAPPPSDPKKHPPQPQTKKDSDTSDDEEDEEAPPPPKPAPKEAEASKPPAAAAETKKPGAVQRIWSTADEVRILKALAAYQKEHGTLPKQDALVDLFAGKLDNPSYGSKELYSKVGSLRTRYLTLSKRGELPNKEHDRQLLDLSKMVWDSDKTTPAAAPAVAAANGHERKGFEEMCELYPYVAEEVNELEAARPGMCKREFGKMDDNNARAMDEKIKKQRVAQIRLEMRRSDLVKEVTKALLDLVHG